MVTPIGSRKQMEQQSYKNSSLFSDDLFNSYMNKRAQLGMDKKNLGTGDLPPEGQPPQDKPQETPDPAKLQEAVNQGSQGQKLPPNPETNTQNKPLVVSSPGAGQLQAQLAQQILDLLFEHNLVSAGGFSLQKFDTSSGLQLVIVPQKTGGPAVQKA